MKILFIHPNMPGQYKHLCAALAAERKNEVVFITKRRAIELPNIRKIVYGTSRPPTPNIHRYLVPAEQAIVQGQAVWRVCRKLKQEGFTPDVICVHPGWGDGLYLKDIYSDTPVLSFFEFYYHAHGSDVDFVPDAKVGDDDRARIRTKNITNLLSLESADWGISPTRWQWQQHPPEFRHKISILHDGIDTEKLKPDSKATVTLPNGLKLTREDEVITYVARNFEPYRGFPTFMKAAEMILKRRPNAHIIAVGADEVSYGKKLPKGQTYRGEWLKKVKLDESRIHWTGMLPYNKFLKVLQVSQAHIYLTYPFVLSWSMLEAMAAGCLLITSDTTPVTEVVTDGENGLLVDFFSPKDIADRVDRVFAHPDRLRQLRDAARKTVEDRYALSKLLPLHIGLVKDLADKKLPPPTAERLKL